MTNKTGIVVLLLAAGEGQRFGGVKQLAALSGEPMVRRVARSLLTLTRPVVAVIGAHADAVSAVLTDLPLSVVCFEGWREGMGSSLAAGVQSIMTTYPDASGLLLCLGDQPLMPVGILQAMISRHAVAADRLLVCEYDGQPAPPVLFPRDLFAELATCQGQRGAHRYIEREWHRTERYVCSEDNGIDVDTRSDLKRVCQLLRSGIRSDSPHSE